MTPFFSGYVWASTLLFVDDRFFYGSYFRALEALGSLAVHVWKCEKIAGWIAG
jgi:hypothetical protein